MKQITLNIQKPCNTRSRKFADTSFITRDGIYYQILYCLHANIDNENVTFVVHLRKGESRGHVTILMGSWKGGETRQSVPFGKPTGLAGF